MRIVRNPVLWLTLVTGLAGAGVTPLEEDPPAAAFAAAEARLLETRPLHVEYRITASGVFTAALEGTLRLDENGGVRLAAGGSFGGQPVNLVLRTEEGLLMGGSGERRFEQPVPGHLSEALLIGMTRMGLLHNLARLTAGKPPDRMAGGVRDWVQATEVRHRLTLAADEPPDDVFLFDIVVAGRPSGEAVLYVDQETGLPRLREQTVRFEQGEMRVREEYVYRH